MSTTSFPQRKSPRLQGYDYRQNGAYFITICTHKRQHLFREISSDEMELNTLGCIAQTCWEQIPAHFPKAEVDAFVVMPNHIHGVLLIIDETKCADYQYEQFSNPIARSLSTMMRSYKSAVTKQINQLLMTDNSPTWQGRFHDHIIRSERGLNVLQQYVANNPVRWQVDRFYNL
ncbi:MAG: transposase [Anaerolineae bacterium]|nr:transposase [Anaerolineae bacterium]